MAQDNRAKLGYLSYNDMLLRISEGKLNAYDLCFCTDTHEIYVIDPDLNPIAIKSRVLIFNSVIEAETAINNNLSTYPGQLISILSNDVYKAYVVNKSASTEKYYVIPLYAQENIDYNTLGNRPIINTIGTLDDPIMVNELENGTYSLSGQYKIMPSEETVFLCASSVLCIVEHISDTETHIKKITSSEIIDYVIIDGVLSSSSVATTEYLSNYATTSYVDNKIAALNYVTQEELENYVSEIIQQIMDSELDSIIDKKIDEKIGETSSDDITDLFN